VFADVAETPATAPATPETAGKTQMTGTGGLTTEKPSILEPPPPQPVIRTRGLFRFLLGFLRHYWVNSGIAVAIMLALGLGNGYTVLWKIFGSANQLLAALTLLVGSCWLFHYRRPVWYTLLPSLFMLVTSLWMLIRKLAHDLPRWPADGPLVVTESLVLAMAVGIVALAGVRWYRTRQEQQVAITAARA
jgi:carbon starvation protein CstA